MKSKVQTYDIRDCQEYYGVLELETLLKQSGKQLSSFIEIDEIRRQSSKVYVPGSTLRNLKLNQVQPSKEEDSVISESELDDMILGDQSDGGSKVE
jgi:hypothetical protein